MKAASAKYLFADQLSHRVTTTTLQANQEAFTSDGWFRSGDLGRFDEGGHLFIVGRKKDIIKLPSGKNVFPEDVEAHYEHSPFVSEVCVLGVPDPASQFKGAEKLCAVVVPNFDYLKDASDRQLSGLGSLGIGEPGSGTAGVPTRA